MGVKALQVHIVLRKNTFCSRRQFPSGQLPCHYLGKIWSLANAIIRLVNVPNLISQWRIIEECISLNKTFGLISDTPASLLNARLQKRINRFLTNQFLKFRACQELISKIMGLKMHLKWDKMIAFFGVWNALVNWPHIKY